MHELPALKSFVAKVLLYMSTAVIFINLMHVYETAKALHANLNWVNRSQQ